jgi:hypothetical protein
MIDQSSDTKCLLRTWNSQDRKKGELVMMKLFKFGMMMVLAVLVCYVPCSVWGADVGERSLDKGLPDGSQEAVADGPFIFVDNTTGTSVYLFQSVLNEGRKISGAIEDMKYYIAPYFVFMAPKSPDITELDDKAVLTVNAQTYSDAILDQALETIRGGLPLEDRSRLSHSNISRLNHSITSFDIQSLPGVSINPIGDDNQRVQLQPVQPITFYIEKSEIKPFKELLAKGQLNLVTKVNYMGKDVQLISMGIGQTDKTLTEKILKDVTGGSAFVTADEVLNVAKGVLGEKGIYIYRDPYTDKKIMEKLWRIFEQEQEKHESFVIRSREDARKLDKALIDGLGIEPGGFLPIINYWDVFEMTHDIAAIKEREEAVRKSYKKFNGSLTGKIWGVIKEFIVSGTVDVSTVTETDDETEIDRRVSAYLDHFKIRNGKEVIFTARGLDLFETGDVQTILNSGALIIAIEPYNAPRDLFSIARFQVQRGKIAAFSIRYSRPKLERQKSYETTTIYTRETWRHPDRTGLAHLDDWVYADRGWKIERSSITLRCNAWAGWVDNGGTWARLDSDSITQDSFHVYGELRLKQEMSNRKGWMKAEGTFTQYVEEERVETEKYVIAPGNELNVPVPSDPFGRQTTIEGLIVYYEDGSTKAPTSAGTYEDFSFSYGKKLPRDVIFRALPRD